MVFKDIDRLLSIERYGSISKAADQLYISRSALTQQMKQWEKELGFSIFKRNHAGVVLTAEGACLIKQLQKMKAEYETTIRHCQKQQQRTRDVVVIGLLPNLRSPFLPKVCREFRKQYGNVDIQFKEYFREDYAASFQAGKFDVSVEYFMNYIHDIRGLRAEKVATTSQVLLVPPEHPLAGRASVGMEELRGQKLIMYRRGITKSEDLLRNYLLQETGVQILDIDAYDGSLYTKCELEGAALLSYSLYEQNFPQFVSVPAAWEIPVPLGFYYRKDSRPVVREFVETAAELFRQ